MARKRPSSSKTPNPHHLFALLVGLGLLVGSTVLTSLDRPDVDAAVSWYDRDYTRREKITVQSTRVSGSSDLNDFQVYLDMSDLSATFWSNVQADGGDILITNASNTTVLPHEVVEMDGATDTGQLWFKADTVGASTDTDFYIYYGNASADNSNSTDVWEDYFGVWHMEDDLTGATMSDSSASSADGTLNGFSADEVIASPLGDGVDIEGVNAYVNSSTITGTLNSFSFWVNPPAAVSNSSACFASLWTTAGVSPNASAYTAFGSCSSAISGEVITLVEGGSRRTYTRNHTITDDWHHVYFNKRSGSNFYDVFVDGTNISISNSSGGSRIDVDPHFYFGKHVSADIYYDFAIDEVRYSSAERSTDWIATEYNNQSNPATFYTVGAAEQESSVSTSANQPTLIGPSGSGSSPVPVLTSSNYSGSGAHAMTNWAVSTSNSCTSGVVWQSTNNTSELTSIAASEYNGTFLGDHASANSFKMNTQYYACVKHDDSPWSTPVSFTTEDLSSWSGYKSINVVETSGSNLSDFTTKIVVSSADHAFALNKMDCSDIRFTDSSGVFVLPHYTAHCDQATSTQSYWVNIPSISAGSTTGIRMYYGNEAANAYHAQVGNVVFPYFMDENDFSDWQNGYGGIAAYSTFAKSGDYLNVAEAEGGGHRAGVALPSRIQNIDSYALEYRFYSANASGVDDFIVETNDEENPLVNRQLHNRVPNYAGQGNFGYNDGANRGYAVGEFTWDTVFEISSKANESANSASYYAYTADGTLLGSAVNRNFLSGSPTGPNHIIFASGGSQNADVYIDFLAIREHASTEPGYGFGNYEVSSAKIFDDDFNGKLDRATVTFTRDIAAGSVATSDFTLSTGHTISAVSVSGRTVTLTLTEAASNDYNTANITGSIVGAVDSTIGESLNSGDFNVINTNTSCPFIDGSASDGDGAVNGSFTLIADYSFTNNYVDQIIDCDLTLVVDGATLTMKGNTSNGAIPHIQVNNLTVTDDATITSFAEGCVRSGANGDGPDENNICVADGQGTGSGAGNKNVKGGAGAYGGNGGVSSSSRAGGTAFGAEASPLFFGASGADGYQGGTGKGGGVIRLTVDGVLTVNGTIDSDGSHGVNAWRGGDGGGSGGSVYISTDSVAASSGVVRARGGGNNGSFGSNGGGGGCGGGGRVALFYNTIHAGTYSTWNSAGASTYAATGCTGARAGANGSFYLGQAVTPPTAPSLSSPSNGSNDVSRAPVLTASTYSDDTNADHTYTDWEIASDSEFSDIVWSSLDDNDDLESITVNASKGTFSGSLSGATQLGSGTWYVRVRYANSAGESSNSSSSSFDTANTAPVVSNLSAVQKNDGSGVVDLSFDVDDADDDQQVRVKVELDTGSGFEDLELDETDGNTTASSGDPKVENDNAYQIGNSAGWVNTQPGLLSLNTVLAASNFSDLSKEVTLRVTANDGASDSSAQSIAFRVDAVAPSEATSFTTTNLTSSSVSLSWDEASDDNFSHYHVQYGQTELNVEALSSGGVWDTEDDGGLATVTSTSTTITGLASETTYYAVICAHDSYGNKTCTSDAIEFFITSSPSLSNYSAAQNQLDQVAVSFRANDPDGESLNVSVEYSIDGGSTWEDPTLSYAGSLNNSQDYQLRSISTSGGAADVSFIWNAAVDVPSSTSISDARLRLRANDGSNNSAYLGSGTNFILDLVSPTTPGSFTASNPTSASVRLDWAASTEDNFQDYKVTYGTSSGNLNSTWDTDDAANLRTRTTTSTVVTSLSQETTYFFKVCAYDNYGHSSCSSAVSKATGSVPTVGSIVPVQKSDGTDHVDVSMIFDDADDNDLRAKVEVSVDGGDTWTAAALRTGDAYTSASTDDPGVNNLSSYQLGITGAYISTSAGENTVSFDLSASNFTDTDIKSAYIRVTPSDLGADGTRISAGPFIVDTVDPTAPANLVQEARVGDIMTLRWDPVTESNFNFYEIWYGKDGTKVGNKNQNNPNAALKFDHITGDTNLTEVENTTTTLVGLEDGATYSVMVCAYDDFGNSACSDVSSFVKNKPPLAGRISLGQPNRDSGKVKVCTRVYDTDKPSQMQLGADYSINDGTSWSKMTIESSGITSSVGSAPGLNNSANYQLGTAGNYIDMSTGENKLCFMWNYRTDLGSVKKNVDFRFRPYDGTDVGSSGNGTGTRSWPPRASFVPTCTNLSCSFDASGSTARSAAITDYTWRFGDGSTGSNVNPSHSFATNGTYYVTLTVTDLNGKRDNYTAKVVVSEDEVVNELANVPPVAALVVSCSGLECSFDSSNSSDSDGIISSYAWTFGDGNSSTSANPSHTFSAAGTYIARLVVTDDDGDKDMTYDEIVAETIDLGSETVDPNLPPVSAFSYTCDGLECSFDSSDSSDSDGSIASYLWQFGDKTGSTSADPSKTFPRAGTYRVQLEVTDDGGLSESSFERITVKASGEPIVPDQPPTASFTYSCDSLACSFDASASSDSDGTIESYIWAYGDGQKRTDEGATPSHTFTTGGTKAVTLVVLDDAGNKDVTYKKFTVTGDELGGGDGGGGNSGAFLIDEVPPTAPTLAKTGTTHETLDLGLNSITDSDLFKREVWISEVETNTNDRNIAGDGGALRWDEGYDPNLLSKSTTATTVDNLEEWTEYYVRVWARDVYGNESSNGSAIRMRTNDRADASDGSESKATNGTGEVTIGSTFGDRDDTETAYATYEYNVGDGWRPMTIGSVASASDGSPAIDGNQVGTADAYIPVDEGDNEVSVVWDSKDDLPNIDISNAQIRVIPNDTIESGEALIMQDIILDNVAPSGFGGGGAVHTASLRRPRANPNDGVLAKFNFHARTALASVLGRAATETATVSWTPVTSESNWYGIASYWVKYGTSSDALTSTWDSGNDSALTTMSTASTNITGLLEDTTYYFKVYVQDAFGNQSSTSVFSVSTSSGGEVVVAGGGGGGFVGEVPSAVLAQNEEDFVFEYELPDHWSAEYIEDLLERDYILELIEADERVLEFMELLLDNPNHSVSREESLFLMAIVRGELPDEDFLPEDQSAFSDVTDDNPLYDVILQSYENGEVAGHPDGSFKPKGTTKRVEALKFIIEILDIDVKDEADSFRASSIFPDVQGGIWYSPYLDYAIENEVVNGYTDGSFRPSDTVTLAEMLKMALLTQ